MKKLTSEEKDNRLFEYNKNPTTCKICGKSIIANRYEDLNSFKKRKYCSLECAYKDKDRLDISDKRIGEESTNNQGCLMKIIEYKKYTDIVVEFQDNYKEKVKTTYAEFKKGSVENRYMPTVQGVGIIGRKYKTKIGDKHIKEYHTWVKMLQRCFSKEYKEKHPTYKDTICCEEWLLFENFYEWLHNQENFNKWMELGYYGNLDKDILIKNNKLYSPRTCLLVPQNVNKLFIKRDNCRGNLPIGVTASEYNTYLVNCNDGKGKSKHIKSTNTIEEAFCLYKEYKENLIKNIAKEEFDKGTITEACYNAMINYKVEIID